jgi:Flp pilus assembly protein TadB
MGIIFFILIAGAWAAFLLPSLFDRRHDRPSESTRAYARTRAKLGTLAGEEETASSYYAARDSEARRQRVFIVLLVLAVSTLVVSIITSSVVWLGVSILVDVLIGAYVGLLLYVRRQTAVRNRTVVPLERVVPTAPTKAEDLDFAAAPPSVRVISG